MMFEGLLDLVSPVFLTDPVFGRIRYQRVGFWEGSAEFQSGTVGVLLDGDRSGPSEDQRRFFRGLTSRYAALWPSLKQSLDSSVASWQTEAPTKDQTYRLVAIDIPVTPLVTEECHLGYEAATSGLHLKAELRGSQVREVLVEC